MLVLALGLIDIGEKWFVGSSGSRILGGMELVDEDWDDADTPTDWTD